MPGSNPKRSRSMLIGDYFSDVILYLSLINYDIINNNKGDKHTQGYCQTCTTLAHQAQSQLLEIYILGRGECLTNMTLCYYYFFTQIR